MSDETVLCRYECHHCAKAFRSWQARNIHEDNCVHAPESDRHRGYQAECANGHRFWQSPAKPFCRCGKGLDLGQDHPAGETPQDRRPQWRKRPKARTR
jgi:hypothetical protein